MAIPAILFDRRRTDVAGRSRFDNCAQRGFKLVDSFAIGANAIGAKSALQIERLVGDFEGWLDFATVAAVQDSSEFQLRFHAFFFESATDRARRRKESPPLRCDDKRARRRSFPGTTRTFFRPHS